MFGQQEIAVIEETRLDRAIRDPAADDGPVVAHGLEIKRMLGTGCGA